MAAVMQKPIIFFSQFTIYWEDSNGVNWSHPLPWRIANNLTTWQYKQLQSSAYDYRSDHAAAKLFDYKNHFWTANGSLMFFWPWIMNWLYINYQLDAMIIIYS